MHRLWVVFIGIVRPGRALTALRCRTRAGAGPDQGDDDRLRGRSVAAHRRRVQRYQRVGLGIVGGGTATRCLVGDDAEGRGSALMIIIGPPGHQVDRSQSAKPNSAMSAGFTKTTRRPPSIPR